MKRVLFFAALCLMSFSMLADYTPFVEEGKTWVVEVDMNQATKVIPETFTLRGDTLVNDKIYKRFYEVYNNEKEGYRGAFREEGRRVYFLPEKSTEEELYYDFTLHTGDTFFDSKVEGIDYEVYIDDSIQTCGHALHRLGLFPPNNPEYASDASVQNLWIEGVGSLWGPEFSIYLGFPGSTMTLRSCRVGDEYIYKDTMHDFITSGTSWIDGYTRDSQTLLNRHHVAGTRCIDGKTYTVMQVQQYNVSSQHEVTKVLSEEYLLREDADGEAWLRMENPTEMAALYGIEWDAETIEGLTDRDLYLFNTRARSAFHVTYGCISSSDETEDKWQTVSTTSGFFRHHVLNDGSYTWWRDALHGDTPQLMVGVGWLGYGPFYGLGETSDGGKRIFPVLYEDGHVVYEDKEALETLGTSSSELWDITTQSEDYAYRPFVEEGKVWKVGDYSGNPVQRVEYYYFDGDTIINGKTCKQMMRQRYVNPEHPDYAFISQLPSLSYVGAWYEEDQNVYIYDSTDKQFKLMYDFSVDDNATLQIHGQSYVIGPRQTGGIKGFKGVYRDVMMCMGGESAYNTTWLEGVGSIEGPIFNVYYGKEYHGGAFLMSCIAGDEVIY
ncbi:MAG: hypothetical protein J5790_03675, partial [Bacteroidaceae bacterium]|nr:hypothetical protein [Bacteroidaceae bacterium]